ncbi:hypothetical protein TCSYLVIO_010353 [Trypanosoma cruzi]|nr:hypothetical protein TCSYLVIO_010353 [Trypanosoma cruzi]
MHVSKFTPVILLFIYYCCFLFFFFVYVFVFFLFLWLVMFSVLRIAFVSVPLPARYCSKLRVPPHIFPFFSASSSHFLSSFFFSSSYTWNTLPARRPAASDISHKQHMTDAIDVTTYADDRALGQVAPSLEKLEPIRGAKVAIEGGKVYVLYFFNTFYRGADPVNEELTVLSEKYGDRVVFVAISNDVDKEKTEKYLNKTIVDENTKKPLRLAPPHILFDEKKATGKKYAESSNLTVMSCPMAFIVGGDGKIAWRQQFLQTFTISQSNFEAQLNHVLAGEALESNGPRPVVQVEEEAVEVEEMSLF